MCLNSKKISRAFNANIEIPLGKFALIDRRAVFASAMEKKKKKNR